MALTVPPAKNYQSPLTAMNSVLGRDPTEGPMQVPLEFDWTTMGAQNGTTAQYAVFVNLQNQSTRNFSQVCGLKVDNSGCGSDVQFVFTDTGEVITIDAYDPCAVVPVFSATTQFYAMALNAIAGDVTRAQALNYCPPPTTVPIGATQQVAAPGQAFANIGGNTQLIPAGVSGTLQSLFLSASVGVTPSGAAGGVAEFALSVMDNGGGGGAKTFLQCAVTVPVGGFLPYQILFQDEGFDWRFNNGLIILNTATGWGTGSGVINMQAKYRAP